MKKISIIIPVYNEQACIESLLYNLQSLQGSYEVLFVDGGSTDQTREIIAGYIKANAQASNPLDGQGNLVCQTNWAVNGRLVESPEKGRSRQMNYGASLATGDILWFVHADSIIPSDALTQIRRIMSKYQVGCFAIKFDSKSSLMAVCAWMSNWRVKWRNIAFGDQGIFIAKEYFIRIGMFAPIPLMEDYQLSLTVKGDKQRIGVAPGVIVTSERRFLRYGRLRTMYRMQRLQHMYRKGEDIEVIANIYGRK